MSANPFCFGVYPGVAQPSIIQKELDELQGEQLSLSVRSYIVYHGPKAAPHYAPEHPEQYAHSGRTLDLVICFQSQENNITDWKNFIQTIIEEYHTYLGSLQISGQDNTSHAGAKTFYPESSEALVEGFAWAQQCFKKLGLHIPVGYPVDMGGLTFGQSPGFVVFQLSREIFASASTDEEELEFSIKENLTTYRQHLLEAGISEKTPIHVIEPVWPVVEEIDQISDQKWTAVVQTIFKLRSEFHIKNYAFDLLNERAEVQKQIVNDLTVGS